MGLEVLGSCDRLRELVLDHNGIRAVPDAWVNLRQLQVLTNVFLDCCRHELKWNGGSHTLHGMAWAPPVVEKLLGVLTFSLLLLLLQVLNLSNNAIISYPSGALCGLSQLQVSVCPAADAAAVTSCGSSCCKSHRSANMWQHVVSAGL